MVPSFRICRLPESAYPYVGWSWITPAFASSWAIGIQEDIERVEQHVREIEQRIERQRAVITQAEESGLSTDGPRNFLWFLKETLSLSRDHLARLLADEFRAGDSR